MGLRVCACGFCLVWGGGWVGLQGLWVSPSSAEAVSCLC